MDLKRMSQDYDVHISLKRLPKSLALRVEGTRSGVREITEHIATMSQVYAVCLYHGQDWRLNPVRSPDFHFQYVRLAVPNAYSAGYDTANIAAISGIC